MLGVLSRPFPLPASLNIASMSLHPHLCSADSRCCTPTATWTARSSGRCLMAPCTTSCGSNLVARMPSLRCMTRSARLPGTEQEPAHKETDVWVDPVPRARRHLPFTQAWLLSQVHTFRKKPLQNSHPDSPNGLFPASKGHPWSGKDMEFGVR